MRHFLFLLPIAVAGSLHAQSPKPFTVDGRGYSSLQKAVSAIGGGDGTIHIAPGTYRECAVQESGRVTFAADRPGSVVFDGVTCEDKAVLVLRGRAARVHGIIFKHLRVADGNGAGIRIEKGNLSVSQSMFVDSQSGILSAIDPASFIIVDHSSFAGLGKDPTGHGAHGIYVGGYGGLRVTNCRFERGTGGHYVKSRAPRIEVLDSVFDDTHGHITNYMIDLSNGARGRIAGNRFIVGGDKYNTSTLITVAPEGGKNRSAGLIVENNRASLAPGVTWHPALVGNWSGEPVIVRNNILGPNISTIAVH